MKSAAALRAAQQMFGNYGFNNTPATTTVPTSVAPNALFQQNLPDVRYFSNNRLITITNDQIPIDQGQYTSTNRSPSPLFEVDDTSSPELTELQHPRRRASESFSVSTPRDGSGSKRRVYSLSIPQDRSRLDPDEKANRAAAAEGLNKGDKRRMQNKLAQRAFRARSKIVNRHVSTFPSSSRLLSRYSSYPFTLVSFPFSLYFIFSSIFDERMLTRRRRGDWKIWKNLPNNKTLVSGT